MRLPAPFPPYGFSNDVQIVRFLDIATRPRPANETGANTVTVHRVEHPVTLSARRGFRSSSGEAVRGAPRNRRDLCNEWASLERLNVPQYLFHEQFFVLPLCAVK